MIVLSFSPERHPKSRALQTSQKMITDISPMYNI